MKLAWFSPLPPDRSEIANHTRRLAGSLEAKFETRFFSENTRGFVDAATGTSYGADLGHVAHHFWPLLNACDLPVYNLGNNPVHFSHTWFLSQAKPGIVVLHDLKLHHFFEGIYRERLEDLPTSLRWMKKSYGQLGVEACLAYWQRELSIGFMAEHFPMTAWAIQGALGVVVHTEHALRTVRKLTDAPVVLAPLPYAAQATPAVATTIAPRRNLIIFGHLNVNRRVVEFLTTLADMPKRQRFEVNVFGEMLHATAVEAAVRQLGLGEQVTLHGYVSDAELARGLARADLAVNLRFPTMGEASASQLRIWEHALPSLVTQTDGYADLPADTVFFVRPEHEAEDIQGHLSALLAQPEKFRAAGLRGRKWLEARHRPEAYVECVGELCFAADELRSRHVQFYLADRVGGAIAPWTDAASVTARENHLAAAIARLASGSRPTGVVQPYKSGY